MPFVPFGPLRSWLARGRTVDHIHTDNKQVQIIGSVNIMATHSNLQGTAPLCLLNVNWSRLRVTRQTEIINIARFIIFGSSSTCVVVYRVVLGVSLLSEWGKGRGREGGELVRGRKWWKGGSEKEGVKGGKEGGGWKGGRGEGGKGERVGERGEW